MLSSCSVMLLEPDSEVAAQQLKEETRKCFICCIIFFLQMGKISGLSSSNALEHTISGVKLNEGTSA